MQHVVVNQDVCVVASFTSEKGHHEPRFHRMQRDLPAIALCA